MPGYATQSGRDTLEYSVHEPANYAALSAANSDPARPKEPLPAQYTFLVWDGLMRENTKINPDVAKAGAGETVLSDKPLGGLLDRDIKADTDGAVRSIKLVKLVDLPKLLPPEAIRFTPAMREVQYAERLHAVAHHYGLSGFKKTGRSGAGMEESSIQK
jgi:hypothetical protein